MDHAKAIHLQYTSRIEAMEVEEASPWGRVCGLREDVSLSSKRRAGWTALWSRDVILEDPDEAAGISKSVCLEPAKWMWEASNMKEMNLEV